MKRIEANMKSCINLNGQSDNNEGIPMRINIPFSQRPYEWVESNITDIFKDYYDYISENKEDENKYFVGTIIGIQKSVNDRISIIDGQQRLTTFYLIAYILYLYLRSKFAFCIYDEKYFDAYKLIDKIKKYYYMVFEKNNELDKLQEILSQINEITSERKEISEDIKNKLNSSIEKSFHIKELVLQSNNVQVVYNAQKQYLNDLQELPIMYSRKSYNEKLKNILSRLYIKYDSNKEHKHELLVYNNDKYFEEDNDESIITQYYRACKVISEVVFKKDPECEKIIPKNKETLDILEDVINNIQFCFIRTENENDAYTLFEVINNRGKDVDDMILIKNLFYQKYTDSADINSNSNVDESKLLVLDEIWNYIFDSKKKYYKKVLLFLFVRLLINDNTINYKDDQSYTGPLKNKYFNKMQNNYSYEMILLDFIKLYAISLLLDKIDLPATKKQRDLYKSEMLQESIVKRTILLLNSLEYMAFIPTICSKIINYYFENNFEIDNYMIEDKYETIINMFKDKFDKYIEKIFNKNAKNLDDKEISIMDISKNLYKLSLMCDGVGNSKEKSSLLYYVNSNCNSTSYEAVFKKAQSDFKNHMINWSYRNSSTNDKIKLVVLFINSIFLDKGKNKIKRDYSIVDVKFLHLDHLEPKSPKKGYEDYFFDDDNRELYINGLGNMMILDSKDNIGIKSNHYLWKALNEVYKKNFESHLTKEIEKMLKSDKCGIKKKTEKGYIYIPNSKFFDKRKDKLINHFESVLSNY